MLKLQQLQYVSPIISSFSVSLRVSALCVYASAPKYAIPQASGVVTLRARTERSALSYIVDPWSSFHRYLMARLFPLHPNSLLVHPPSPPFLSAICWGSFHALGWCLFLCCCWRPPCCQLIVGPTWQRYIHKHPFLLQTLLFHGRPIHSPPFGYVLSS